MELLFFVEPGYYEKDQFGIRIEDIVQIVPASVEHDFNGRGALTFKTVTMCPIQTKLINKSLLTEKEVLERTILICASLILIPYCLVFFCRSFI